MKPKMSALVASAIRNLREIRGSTSKEIVNYIKSQFSNESNPNMQKQIYTALKRGLDYGILKKNRGYYSLNTDPDMLYNAYDVVPMEQSRRRRRRRGRALSRRRRRGRRVRTGRRRGRRVRRRRRSRRSSSTPRARRYNVTKCKNCSSKKRTEDVSRKTPVESLRQDLAYLYKKGSNNRTSSRHQSRSRTRNQTRSRSNSSDKMTYDRDLDQS